jgi:hypothetical protein
MWKIVTKDVLLLECFIVLAALSLERFTLREVAGADRDVCSPTVHWRLCGTASVISCRLQCLFEYEQKQTFDLTNEKLFCVIGEGSVAQLAISTSS